MNVGINNNYQCNTNFGCNKIKKLGNLNIKDKKQILESLKHEMPQHSAVDFYKNMGFKPFITLPYGTKIYFPTSLKEMEEVIAKDYKG